MNLTHTKGNYCIKNGPRTTALGGLPNISHLIRKPEPLGTKFRLLLVLSLVASCTWKYRGARKKIKIAV
jgi:hypothetical protein